MCYLCKEFGKGNFKYTFIHKLDELGKARLELYELVFDKLKIYKIYQVIFNNLQKLTRKAMK